MVGEVKEVANDGKFISNLFSDEGIDKLPEVGCTKVADRVNELLVENGMKPSDAVQTYTVRDIVKKVTGALGLSAWEVNASPGGSSSPVDASRSGMHLQAHWKQALYKHAASKVLECVERADGERPAHIVSLDSSDNNPPCEIVTQTHPVSHEEQIDLLVQAATELQAKDTVAESQRLRYVCPS